MTAAANIIEMPRVSERREIHSDSPNGPGPPADQPMHISSRQSGEDELSAMEVDLPSSADKTSAVSQASNGATVEAFTRSRFLPPNSPPEDDDATPALSHTASTISTSESRRCSSDAQELLGSDNVMVVDTDETPSLRRSSRAKRPRPASEASPTQDVIVMTEARRNPKRRVQEETEKRKPVMPGVDLLEEALKPMSVQDVDEWEGWHELESEPAFFNIILRDLGVKDVRIQEIYGIDDASLANAPQPVYGLIFLFQYLGDTSDGDEEADASNVWFANQTTENACATVALLNIIMNADVNLGEELQSFKASTRELSTPLRGQVMTCNAFIRSCHNLVARRMDYLNSDLFLQNEEAEAASSAGKKRSKPRRTTTLKKPRKTKKRSSDSGFHFVAYVPADGAVWELDGLKSRPVRLCSLPADGTDWTAVASPHIRDRMLQYQEDQLAFTLMALGRSPLPGLTRDLAKNVLALEAVAERVAAEPMWRDALGQGNDGPGAPMRTRRDPRLVEYGLGDAEMADAEVDPDVVVDLADPALDLVRLRSLQEDLAKEQTRIEKDIHTQRADDADAEEKVRGRQRDFTPAIHAWVRKLAAAGKLEELAKDVGGAR